MVALEEKRLVAVRILEEAVLRVVWPVTVRVFKERLVNPAILGAYKVPETLKLVLEALPNVVCPVTLRVEEKVPVVPTRAP